MGFKLDSNSYSNDDLGTDTAKAKVTVVGVGTVEEGDVAANHPDWYDGDSDNDGELAFDYVTSSSDSEEDNALANGNAVIWQGRESKGNNVATEVPSDGSWGT